MPTYEYRCRDCATSLEVVQKFSDDPMTVCPTCGGRLRKLFSPVGVVFKGSGFYKTDSRAKSSSSAGDSTGVTAADKSDAVAKGAGAKTETSAPAPAAGTNGGPSGTDSGTGAKTTTESNGKGFPAKGPGEKTANKDAVHKVA